MNGAASLTTQTSRFPIQQIRRIAETGDIDQEGRAMVIEAVRRYLDGESLEKAFRLDSAQLVRQCHQALRQAGEVLRGDEDLSDWDLSGRLYQAVRRFNPRQKREPSQVSPLDRALQAAFDAGVRFPRSRRRLYDLLAGL